MSTLNKVLDILEAFLDVQEESVSLAKIAEMTGLNKSSVDRMLLALTKRGYLKQPRRRGNYYLGAKMAHMSFMIKHKMNVKKIAEPYLTALSNLTAETISLAFWDGKNTGYTETIPSKHEYKIISKQSQELPLYCTGMGKIFLAHMSEAELDAYLSSETFQKYTENTITDTARLKEYLATVRAEDISYCDAEFIAGVGSVAVPIRDAEGSVIAAIAVILPTVKSSPTKLASVSSYVKDTGRDISRKLGYVGPVKPPEISSNKRETTPKFSLRALAGDAQAADPVCQEAIPGQKV